VPEVRRSCSAGADEVAADFLGDSRFDDREQRRPPPDADTIAVERTPFVEDTDGRALGTD
jgi:hypothetical protein